MSWASIMHSIKVNDITRQTGSLTAMADNSKEAGNKPGMTSAPRTTANTRASPSGRAFGATGGKQSQSQGRGVREGSSGDGGTKGHGGGGQRVPRPCRYFGNGRICYSGANCRFLHDAAAAGGGGGVGDSRNGAKSVKVNGSVKGSLPAQDAGSIPKASRRRTGNWHRTGGNNASGGGIEPDMRKGKNVESTTAGTTTASGPTKRCVICQEDRPIGSGISCSKGHFVCKDKEYQCLPNYIAMKSEIQVIRANGGKIPCPLRPTDANAKNPSLGLTCDSYLSEHSILRTLTPAHIARFVEALRKGMEVAITNEQLALSNTSSSSTTPAPKPNTPSLDKQDISRKRHHVVTEILNLKRPCCGFVLPDWTGCCAVTCDRCLAGRNSFCGICLRMDGPDAHKHIHRMHPGQMFLSEQKIKEVHQKLRHERLVGYFATMDAAVARAVMKDVTVFLEGTGVIGQAILREADRRRNDGGFRVRANGVLNPTPDEIQVQEVLLNHWAGEGAKKAGSCCIM